MNCRVSIYPTLNPATSCAWLPQISRQHNMHGASSSDATFFSERGGPNLELGELLRVAAPDLARPEHARRRFFQDVLQVVPDDVGLLQEQPHVVRQRLREEVQLGFRVKRRVGETGGVSLGMLVLSQAQPHAVLQHLPPGMQTTQLTGDSVVPDTMGW